MDALQEKNIDLTVEVVNLAVENKFLKKRKQESHRRE